MCKFEIIGGVMLTHTNLRKCLFVVIILEIMTKYRNSNVVEMNVSSQILARCGRTSDTKQVWTSTSLPETRAVPTPTPKQLYVVNCLAVKQT